METTQDTLDAATTYDRCVLGSYARAPLTLVRGRGTRVWDDQGREFLDFTTGIAVNTLGHAHPGFVEAIRRQAGELVHASNLFRNPQQARLAARLVERIAPGRVVFGNSGAEANEFLLKLARRHGTALAGEGKRYGVVTALDSFHGRTFGGMSATPQAKVQDGFRPLLPGFTHAKLNDLAAWDQRIDDSVAAVLVETIQGEGGIHPCTGEFLRGLRKLCTERGALLLVDEVQCGIGRTGDFFAYSRHGIHPDAVAMAKGLGGGYPIGAVWVAEQHAGLFVPGTHGSTYAGSPLACAAANAVIDAIESEHLLEHVKRLAPGFHAALGDLVERFPSVLSGVRGQGFLVGLQVREPHTAAAVVAAMREAGILAPGAGSNTVRLLPPLNVSAAELDEAVRRLARALATFPA